jgi:hypothetical protein
MAACPLLNYPVGGETDETPSWREGHRYRTSSMLEAERPHSSREEEEKNANRIIPIPDL